MELTVLASSYMVFWVPVCAFFIAQVLKNLIFWYHDKKITWKRILTDGGMPSAHSAVISAVCTSIYFIEGFTTLFFFSFFVMMIVVRDAYGVRNEAGKQAAAINKIVKELGLPHQKALKELVGHTKLQALFGVALGVFVAMVAFSF